jgi:hypothetical protein
VEFVAEPAGLAVTRCDRSPTPSAPHVVSEREIDMTKAKFALLPLAAMVAGIFVVNGADAAGPYGWRYNAPGYYYYQDKQLDRAAVEKSARTALDAMSKGEAWKSPRGVTHIPLLNKDKLAVGNLWEDIDLKKVEVGAYWTGARGTRVELVAGGKVVGMLWLP